jgi:DNA-binding NarL/FixJ family response regulator
MVGLASTTAQAVQQAVELRPDVVLVDIDLGRESGLSWPSSFSQWPVWISSR